ncbi:hypothetical protein HPB52_001567 [Rhipicephalus sanguineus]|uniref:HTH psq-type domain-containing protein n=1 Tax=Rhipicephalus sanguineus TaxID=34632 RepID=A0A9D4PIP4_RHISA|nr:hypothetical protein HPB52_001567 [Rhipicephalus sanguineus]
MSRNRKPLTLGEKLRIIEEAEKRNGATKASIARDLNIPESSLKTILAKKDSILLNAAKFGLNRKAPKDGKYAAMEKALVECEAALPVDDEPEFGSLELPGSFADYVGADDDVAVCSEVSLDDIIETVRPDTAGTSDEEEMDDAAEASVSGKSLPDVSLATSLPSALFRIYMGNAPEEEQKKRLKDVRKHLAQKLGDLRRK